MNAIFSAELPTAKQYRELENLVKRSNICRYSLYYRGRTL